jgi:hypothetical protein
MAAKSGGLGASPLASGPRSTASDVRSTSFASATRCDAAAEGSTRPSLAAADRTLERGGCGLDGAGIEPTAGGAVTGADGTTLGAGG